MKVFQYHGDTLEVYKQILSDLSVPIDSRLEVIVDDGLDSPYSFGQEMRSLVESETAAIYKTCGVYWCINDDTGRAAFKRSSDIGAALLPLQKNVPLAA